MGTCVRTPIAPSAFQTPRADSTWSVWWSGKLFSCGFGLGLRRPHVLERNSAAREKGHHYDNQNYDSDEQHENQVPEAKLLFERSPALHLLLRPPDIDPHHPED